MTFLAMKTRIFKKKIAAAPQKNKLKMEAARKEAEKIAQRARNDFESHLYVDEYDIFVLPPTVPQICRNRSKTVTGGNFADDGTYFEAEDDPCDHEDTERNEEEEALQIIAEHDANMLNVPSYADPLFDLKEVREKIAAAAAAEKADVDPDDDLLLSEMKCSFKRPAIPTFLDDEEYPPAPPVPPAQAAVAELSRKEKKAKHRERFGELHFLFDPDYNWSEEDKWGPTVQAVAVTVLEESRLKRAALSTLKQKGQEVLSQPRQQVDGVKKTTATTAKKAASTEVQGPRSEIDRVRTYLGSLEKQMVELHVQLHRKEKENEKLRASILIAEKELHNYRLLKRIKKKITGDHRREERLDSNVNVPFDPPVERNLQFDKLETDAYYMAQTLLTMEKILSPQEMQTLNFEEKLKMCASKEKGDKKRRWLSKLNSYRAQVSRAIKSQSRENNEKELDDNCDTTPQRPSALSAPSTPGSPRTPGPTSPSISREAKALAARLDNPDKKGNATVSAINKNWRASLPFIGHTKHYGVEIRKLAVFLVKAHVFTQEAMAGVLDRDAKTIARWMKSDTQERKVRTEKVSTMFERKCCCTGQVRR